MTVSKRASEIYQAAKKVATSWTWRAEWSKAMKQAWREIMETAKAAVSKVTYKMKKWGAENTIYDFRIEDASESLLNEIEGRYEQSAKLSYAPLYTFVRHLVVECDHNNHNNPSLAEVARNREIVEILKDMGAVAA